MESTALIEDLGLLNHFSVLVYPFLHDITGPEWQTRAAALDPRWVPWWLRLNDEELAVALDDSSFFLPYIRGALFPETIHLAGEPRGENCSNWTRLLREWAGRGLGAVCGDLGPGSVLRLTCHLSLREALSEFSVIQHREQDGVTVEHEEVQARMDWVDVLLFPSGIGFLMFKVSLRQDDPMMSRLIDLNYYMRTVLPPNLSWTLPTLHFPGAATPLRMADLMNLLTQGMVGRRTSPLTDGVNELHTGNWRTSSPYTDSEAGQAYGERCQTLVFACVHLGDAKRAGPGGAFPSGEDRLLFEIGSCVGLGNTLNNPLWVPAPDYGKKLATSNRMFVWRCWRAMGLKDSFVFLATEDMGFTRHSLPHNIENDYLPLYLFTLYQKYQLFVFASDFMSEVAQVENNLNAVRSLMERFVNFRNQYWFNEVTRKALGGEIYRTMQQGLETSQLYQLVTSSVRDARDYIQQLHDRRFQRSVMLITLVFGPLAILFGAIRVFFEGEAPTWFKIVLVCLFASLGLGAVVYYRIRHARRRSMRLTRHEEGEASPPPR
jgi:hypothetical protein